MTLAIEQVESAFFLQNFEIQKEKNMLWFWKQVHGVSQEAVVCDGCIEIPQLGTKHSLNIAVSAGIVVWDLFKQFNN
jgi:tRNA G18 (ribose-2'-O)-methylase SpoU